MYREDTIWLLLDSRSNGGIETHVLELAMAIDGYGLKVKVVFLEYYGEHPLRAALERSGIETLSLDGRLGSLISGLRRARPGLLHSHGYKAGLFACLASRIAGCAHVSTFHSGDPGRGKVALYDWLHRQASRFIDVNLAVSAEIAARLPAKALVVDNFILIPEMTPKTGRRLAFVGRLSEEKGPDRLLEIAAQIAQQDFDLYGDGPLMAALRNRAIGNCRFHGNQADMDAHWCQIELLLMPSRFEGLPMAALEAMARGIPVIAFDTGALGRLIEPGKNGWLIPQGDLDAFRRAIENWLALDDEHKQSIRRAARQRIVEEFSSRNKLPTILEQYRLATARRIPACDAFCE